MIRQFVAIVLGLGICVSAQAGVLFTFDNSNDPSHLPGVIPDNNPIGFTDAHVIGGLNPIISGVVFTLTVSGGADSDLAGYLRLGNTANSPDFAINFGSLTTGGNGPNTYTLINGSSVFNNANPNDTWTLFLADQHPLGQDSAISWSLNISTVPEPINEALAFFGIIALSGFIIRFYFRRKNISTA